METITPALLKYQIYAHYIRLSGGTEGFLSEDRLTLLPQPENDFYLNINLNRTYNVNSYVDVQKPEEVFVVERQEFNPHYIEFDFFNTVERIKITKSEDLTPGMYDFIKQRRPDVFTSTSTDTEVADWFEKIGKNEFPWEVQVGGATLTTTLADIEESDFNTESAVSKASGFPIIIYR